MELNFRNVLYLRFLIKCAHLHPRLLRQNKFLKSLFFALYPLIYGRSLVEFLFNTRESICLVSDRSKPPVSLSRFLSPHAKPRSQSDGEQMTFDVGK